MTERGEASETDEGEEARLDAMGDRVNEAQLTPQRQAGVGDSKKLQEGARRPTGARLYHSEPEETLRAPTLSRGFLTSVRCPLLPRRGQRFLSWPPLL